ERRSVFSRRPIATAWVIALRVANLLLNFIPVIILLSTPRWVLDANQASLIERGSIGPTTHDRFAFCFVYDAPSFCPLITGLMAGTVHSAFMAPECASISR